MRKLLIIACALVVALPGLARAGDAFGVSWNISLPAGDTADFTSGLQFRGASLEWRNFYKRDTAFGFSGSWNAFNEAFTGTFAAENFAVTGKRWQYVNTVPLYLTWHKYQAGDRRGKRLYYGLNAGLAYVEKRTTMGLWAFEMSEWHPALAPEIGLQLPWDAFVGTVSLRYNFAFETGDHDTQQWLELRFGFGMD